MSKQKHDVIVISSKNMPELTTSLLAASELAEDDHEPLEPIAPSGSGWLEPPPQAGMRKTKSITKLLGLQQGSKRACVYNLFSSVLGAGVLGLPFAARKYGFFGGLLLIVPFSCASLYTLRLLQWSSNLAGVKGYRELCAVTLAMQRPWTLPLVSIVLFFNTFGSLVVYLLVLGDLLAQFASAAGLGHAAAPLCWLASPTTIVVLMGTLVALPLSLVRDLSKLRYTSFLSLGSILYLASLLAVRAVQQALSDGGARVAEAVRLAPVKSAPTLFGELPTFIYAFSCHFNFFAAVAGMRRTSERDILTVQVASIGLSLCVYLVVVGAVLLLYAGHTAADFLVNLDAADVAFDVAKGAYTLVLVAAYPLNCHPCTRALIDGVPVKIPSRHHEAARVGVTVLVVGLSMLFAIFIPNIAVALSLVGGTATSSILYVFPALFFLHLTRPGNGSSVGPKSSPTLERQTAKLKAAHTRPVEVAEARVPLHRALCFGLLGLGAFAFVCSIVGLFAKDDGA